jgi:hypothetical protein
MKRVDGTIKIAIVGGRHYPEGWNALGEGDTIFFRREPRNPFDPFAIEVVTRDGIKIGHISNSPKTTPHGFATAKYMNPLIEDGETCAVVVHRGEYMATAIVNSDNQYLEKFLPQLPDELMTMPPTL